MLADACALMHTAIHVGCNQAAALDHAKRHAVQQSLHAYSFFDVQVTYYGRRCLAAADAPAHCSTMCHVSE